MKRREFIELSAQSIGGLLIYSLAGEPLVMNAQEGTVKVPAVLYRARGQGGRCRLRAYLPRQ